MAAELINQDGDEVTLQVTINLRGSLLEAEDKIQDAVNAVGRAIALCRDLTSAIN